MYERLYVCHPISHGLILIKCLIGIVLILGTLLRVTQHQTVKFGNSTLISLRQCEALHDCNCD